MRRSLIWHGHQTICHFLILMHVDAGCYLSERWCVNRQCCSTWGVSSVHRQAGERHRPQAELGVGKAARRRRQDSGILGRVQSRHWDGTYHSWKTKIKNDKITNNFRSLTSNTQSSNSAQYLKYFYGESKIRLDATFVRHCEQMHCDASLLIVISSVGRRQGNDTEWLKTPSVDSTLAANGSTAAAAVLFLLFSIKWAYLHCKRWAMDRCVCGLEACVGVCCVCIVVIWKPSSVWWQ